MALQKVVTVNKQKAIELTADATLESAQQIDKRITEQMLKEFEPLRAKFMRYGADRVVLTKGDNGMSVLVRCIKYKNITMLFEYFFFSDYEA